MKFDSSNPDISLDRQTIMMSLGNRLLIGVLILCFSASGSRAEAGKFNGLYFASKGSGEPIVLIHGGQMDRRMWDTQFTVLAKYYRVIRYDIRGFGKSDVPTKPYSDVEDLHSLLNHLRVKKAT